MSLPRTSEHLIRDHTKYRIGRIVYASVSPDETRLGFGFPKEERAALVTSEPGKFMMPLPSDERYNWVRARLEAVEVDELRELLIDAWRMCVPKKVAAAYLESLLPIAFCTRSPTVRESLLAQFGEAAVHRCKVERLGLLILFAVIVQVLDR